MLSTKEKEKSKNSKKDTKEIENKCFVIKKLGLCISVFEQGN